MKLKTDLVIPFTWEERRPVLLERFFYIPKNYSYRGDEELVRWEDERVFGTDRPVAIEFCSGNGQWLVARAKERPDWNWVGVEMKFDRARKLWLAIDRAGLSNVYVVCGEGRGFLDHHVLPDSIGEAYVNFPDPWPKLRHAKHRIIQTPFLKLLSRAVHKGGAVTLVTDDASYRDQMVSTLSETAWVPEWDFPHFITLSEGYGASYFRTLWEKKGRAIFCLRYRNG
jgi:tRNA (guanine-N7-)-methyltransferase